MAADRTLVARARAGETAAFGALLRRHQPRLLRGCRRALADDGAAADAAREAALVAWLQLDRLRDPARRDGRRPAERRADDRRRRRHPD